MFDPKADILALVSMCQALVLLCLALAYQKVVKHLRKLEIERHRYKEALNIIETCNMTREVTVAVARAALEAKE